MDLPFSLAEYRDRLRRTREGMAREGIDTLVTRSPENIFYLTGLDTYGYFTWQVLIVGQKREEPLLVTRIVEEPAVYETSILPEATYYQIPQEDPIGKTAELIRKEGLDKGVLGPDKNVMTAEECERLCAGLPGMKVTDASHVIGELKIRKSPRELVYMRKASRLADLGMDAAIEACRVGATELEVVAAIQEAMTGAGSEYPAVPILLSSGPRTTMIHGMPSRRRIEAGDVVVVEHGGVYCRYHAVLMRTIFMGDPPKRVQEVIGKQIEALNAATAKVRPGRPVPEANAACVRVLQEANLERWRLHRLGYSVGISYPPAWLEPLNIWEGDPHAFEPGMLFTLEPNLGVVPEHFGVKTGDTVHCTEDGHEMMTRHPRELIVKE